MKNIEYLALEELFRKVNTDKQKSGYAYPIAAVIFDRKNKKILNSALNIKVEGDEDLTVEEKSENHAESLNIEKMIATLPKHSDLSIMITTPPCHPCYEKIVAANVINEIIFITRKYQSIKWKYRDDIIEKKGLRKIDYKKINKQIEGVSNLLLENKQYIRNLENICRFSRK